MDNDTYGDIYIYSSMIIIIHKQANQSLIYESTYLRVHNLCKLASFFINPQAMQSLIHESTIPSLHACVVDDDDDDDDDH
jgi:hypothetical protein